MATAPAQKRIRIKYVPIDSLKPADYNPRLISDTDMTKLQRSLAEWGVVDPVIVRRENGEVVGGHQRLEAARREGITEVPVVYLDGLTDDQAKMLNVALNKISGEWDMPKLGALLLELGDVPDLDLSVTGFDPAEAKVAVAAYQRGQPGLTDDDAVPEAPEPITKPSDLWLLGEHRLLCGDATKAEDVARLMGGEKADTVIADPPYGIGLDTDYSRMPKTTRGFVPIVGDQGPFDARPVREMLGHVEAQFWFGADYYASSLGDTEVQGAWLVWDKRVEERYDAGFGSAFELCWSSRRRKRAILRYQWFQNHAADPKEATNRVHPTQKPTALYEELIGDAAAIYDPFLGSGTTLIACEKLGRRCYGMEIEPRYVDVAVKRWEEYTGKEAVRDGA